MAEHAAVPAPSSDRADIDRLADTVRDWLEPAPRPTLDALDELVARLKAAEARVAELETLLTQLEATITAKQPPDEVFRFFQRLHGLPEVGAPKHPAEQRVAELEAALREPYFVKGVYLCRYCWRADGHDDDCTVLRLAGDGGGSCQKHGRGCGCTPCKAEDWDAVEARLAGDGGGA